MKWPCGFVLGFALGMAIGLCTLNNPSPPNPISVPEINGQPADYYHGFQAGKAEGLASQVNSQSTGWHISYQKPSRVEVWTATSPDSPNGSRIIHYEPEGCEIVIASKDNLNGRIPTIAPPEPVHVAGPRDAPHLAEPQEQEIPK